MEKIAEGFAFLEGPRWRDGALWFSDMHDHRIYRFAPGAEPQEVCKIAGRPSGLGWTPDGELLIVSMLDKSILQLGKDGALSVYSDLSGLVSKRINDMVVASDGAAYVGNFGFDFDQGEAPASTVLVRVAPDGAPSIAADGLMFPNGMAITPDGATLIVAETFATRLTAFDIAGNGALTNRRIWADLPEEAYPDGIALDESGGVWVAAPVMSACLRVEEGGKITEEIQTRDKAIACALSDENPRALYILTSSELDPDQCREKRGAGIYRVQLSGA